MHMHRLNNAEAGQQDDSGGAAVADEGQRYAHHRQQAADHAGVDQHVEEERQREGAGDEATEGVAGVGRNPQAAGDDRKIQAEQQQDAQPAEFLAVDGQDEVGVAFGQEVQLRLGAFQITLAGKATRTYRDL